MKVIGYVSVPEAEQLDRELLNRQTAAIHRLCHQRGWTLVEVVRDVEAAKNTSRERAGLRYALELVAGGDADCLAVSQLRRLSPSAAAMGSILRSIAASRARLVALDLGLDTATPEGRKAANVLIAMSGWERERVAERTRKGLQAARAKGVPISRPAVEDVPVLKQWIAAMRAQGMTLQAISDRLNQDRVPTLRGGKEWRPSSVQAAAGYRRPPRTWPGDQAQQPGTRMTSRTKYATRRPRIPRSACMPAPDGGTMTVGVMTDTQPSYKTAQPVVGPHRRTRRPRPRRGCAPSSPPPVVGRPARMQVPVRGGLRPPLGGLRRILLPSGPRRRARGGSHA